MLADMHLELTKALDIELDASGALGNVRCKRFACVVDDGKVRPCGSWPVSCGPLSLQSLTLARAPRSPTSSWSPRAAAWRTARWRTSSRPCAARARSDQVDLP